MTIDLQSYAGIKRDVFYGHDIEPPVVDLERCNGCGLCARVCTGRVFEIVDRKAKVARGIQCFACGHCWAVCPEEAVVQAEAATATDLKPAQVPAISPEDLLLLIRERRSTRLFRDSPVEREQLARIADAGRYGPTAGNRQDVDFVIVSGRDKVAELRQLVERFMEKMFSAVRNPVIGSVLRARLGRAPVDQLRYYSVAYGIAQDGKEKDAYFVLPFGSAVMVAHAQSFDSMAHFNCPVALYNCALMAQTMGLGSCFLGFVQLAASEDKDTKHWLGIPEENQAYGAMVLGRPAVRYRRLIERKQPQITWR